MTEEIGNQGRSHQQSLGYWTQQLSGLEPLHLPTDHSRPAVSTYHGDAVDFTIAPALAQRLDQLCQQEGATLQIGFLSLVAILLGRYSRQNDFAIGIPTWGRNHPDLEQLVGCFINTLPIRFQLNQSQSFRQHLREARSTCINAYDHQEIPFQELVEALQPQRDRNQHPLIQVLLQLLELPNHNLQLQDLDSKPLPVPAHASPLDLHLYFVRDGQAIKARITYRTELFQAERLQRMSAHLLNLLAQALANPDRPLSTLSLLTPEEEEQIQRWSKGPELPATIDGIQQLIEQQVRRTPDAIALVADDLQLSYTQLDQRSNRLAHWLIDQGARNDQPIGICLERSAELLIALLAVLKSGAPFLPLDPSLPSARLDQICRDAKPLLILSCFHLAEQLAGIETTAVLLDQLDRHQGHLATFPTEPPNRNVPLGALAYILYTSGSTGTPKGVAVDHAALADRCLSLCDLWQLDQQQVVLAHSPIGFDVSLLETLLPLSRGAKVILVNQEQRQDLNGLVRLIQEQRCTRVLATPAHWRAILETGFVPSRPSLYLVGGERLENDLAETMAGLSNARFLNSYGPTEATIQCLAHPIEVRSGPITPIGRPIAGTDVAVLDPAGCRCGVGVIGELHISGRGLARGYLGQNDLTAKRFVEHTGPGSFDSRLYRSGDLAAWNEDGDLIFHGRVDEQIKFHGQRIEPGEIESALQAHPEVSQVVVIRREDKPGIPQLVAYWTPKNTKEGGETATSYASKAEGLKKFLATKLAAAIIPSHFVQLKQIPITTNGKLDRNSLPALSTDNENDNEDATSSWTSKEQHIRMIWQHVLGRDHIELDDNFFNLGGHSLAAARVAARIEQKLGTRIPIARIFETPTIRALAELAEKGLELEGSKPSTNTRSKHWLDTNNHSYPASASQARFWFLEQLDAAHAAYNMAALWGLRGSLNIEALQSALNGILERHLPLRSALKMDDGNLYQSPDYDAIITLKSETMGRGFTSTTVNDLVRAELGKPFNLSKPPLLRARLIQTNSHQHLLLLVVHHAAADGWSWGVLSRDLSHLYRGALLDGMTGLEPIRYNYGDFAADQHQGLDRRSHQQSLGYWTQQLSGLEPLHLPTDHSRPAVSTYHGDAV
ncbi:MAG: amino acid adenylation domain-containing protein, partial [Prochlorococcaceae cyanobacterium]